MDTLSTIFGSIADALAAVAARDFIAGCQHGAGTWPDGDRVDVPNVAGGTLTIADKVGDDAPERWIEFRIAGRLVVTFVYNHHTKTLVRDF